MDFGQATNIINELRAIRIAQQKQADSLAAIAGYLQRIASKA